MGVDVPGLDWSDERIVPAFQAIEQLTVYDIRGASQDEQVAATIIAGIVNRPQPYIYLMSRDDDATWLERALSNIPQTHAPQRGRSALFALLDMYRSLLKGLIVFDPALPDSLNVATTIAGQRDGIVVPPGMVEELQHKYDLPILEDLQQYRWSSRLQAYRWAQQNLLAGANSRIIAGLDPRAFCGLRSFLVATRAFVYWLDSSKYLPERNQGTLSERGLVQQLLQTFTGREAVHLGWFVHEPSGVALTSQAAIPVLASDYFANLEVWTASLPSTFSISSHKAVSDSVAVANKIYVSFTMSDGDNIQYCQHRLLSLWSDNARGSVHCLGNLSERY